MLRRRAFTSGSLLPIVLAFFMLSFTSCQKESPSETKPDTGADAPKTTGSSGVYPAQPGFDLQGSDPEAIALADKMMEKMGGMDAWNNARFIAWDFFGQYQIWDKKESLYRHEKGNTVTIMSLEKPVGKIFVNGQLLKDSTRILNTLNQTQMHFLSNTYFLFLPYKLKDDGTRLTYRGEATSMDGRPADMIRITFDSTAGYTPNNMHMIWIDKETGLMSQWAFYGDKEDINPAFIRNWSDYKDYNGLLLATNRDSQDDKLAITDLVVTNAIPKEIFLSARPIDRSNVKPQ